MPPNITDPAIRDLRSGFRWSDVLERFDWNATERFNIAHEGCVRWAEDRGRVAMIWVGTDGRSRHLTYHDLHVASNRFANVLAANGVGRGDRVSVLLPRVPESFISALAIWKVGGALVPLFGAFAPDALRFRLRTAGVSAVVTNHGYRTLAGESLHEDVPLVVVPDDRGRGLRRGDLSFWEEVERADPGFSAVETKASDPCAVIFTSGTTGPPKGCVIPHAGLIGLVPFVEHVMMLRPDDLMWATADPSWVFGLMSTGMTPMALGFPRLVYEGDFDVAGWWDIAERFDVTHLTGAPTAYRSLVAGGERHLEGRRLSINAATSAGEPLNPEPMRWFEDHLGTIIRDAYGLTEIGFAVGNLRSIGHDVEPGSAGVPLPGYDVIALSPDGDEVPPGEPGTIAVRGHEWFLGSGYWGQDDAWDAKWHDGYFVTGDTAVFDEDGFMWFVGRADDVIITSGFNVGPFEVESALVSHAAVAEAAVVAKPNERRGNIVKAYVVLGDAKADPERVTSDLQDVVREQVGKHAYPREIEYLADLPRTVSGKIRRVELRERARAEGGQGG